MGQSELTRATASKRRTPRRLFQRPMGVLVRGHYLVVGAKQLSEGGLLFEVQPPPADQVSIQTNVSPLIENLKTGVSIAVSVLLPGSVGLVLRGQVIYLVDDKLPVLGYGVKFDAISLHQRRLIRNYVSSKPVGE